MGNSKVNLQQHAKVEKEDKITIKKQKHTFAAYSTRITRQVVSRCGIKISPLIQKMQRLCQPL